MTWSHRFSPSLATKQERTVNKMNTQKESAWLQISAGQGPKECGWVVAQIYMAILKEALEHRIDLDCIEATAFDKGLRKQSVITPDAYRSVLLRLEGTHADLLVQNWSGTIKWQGHSPYRPKHKRVNWFVGVEPVCINTAKTQSISELMKDVKIETTKSRSPGGQHVNKTSSAVRLNHKPSGIRIRMESDRSQHRNKKLALEKLQLMLAHESDLSVENETHERWLNHYQIQRGKPVKTFSGPLFQRI